MVWRIRSPWVGVSGAVWRGIGEERLTLKVTPSQSTLAGILARAMRCLISASASGVGSAKLVAKRPSRTVDLKSKSIVAIVGCGCEVNGWMELLVDVPLIPIHPRALYLFIVLEEAEDRDRTASSLCGREVPRGYGLWQ